MGDPTVNMMRILLVEPELKHKLLHPKTLALLHDSMDILDEFLPVLLCYFGSMVKIPLLIPSIVSEFSVSLG